MNRMMIGAVALVMGMGSSLACAETTAPRADGEQDEQMLSRADLNALTDARLGVIKAALQMTPDQAKYWPAIEEAVRARAAGRLQRLKSLAALRDKGGDADPVALLQERASNLIQRGTDLKKVADAWEPLYKTLNDEQKQRMRLFAADFLKLVINAAQVRRKQIEEEVEE